MVYRFIAWCALLGIALALAPEDRSVRDGSALDFATVTIERPQPAPEREIVTQDDAYLLFVEEALERAGLPALDHVTYLFTDVGNCGSELSPAGTGGGCAVTYEDGSVVIYISPTAFKNGSADHVLFHEYAHAIGIHDECQAEYFAMDYVPAERWTTGYPQCGPHADL